MLTCFQDMLAATRHGKRLHDHAKCTAVYTKSHTKHAKRISRHDNMVPDMLAGFIDMLTGPLDMTNVSRIVLKFDWAHSEPAKHCKSISRHGNMVSDILIVSLDMLTVYLDMLTGSDI
jgi:hypothetical protein